MVFFLGFEGLVLANLLGVAALKTAQDRAEAEGGSDYGGGYDAGPGWDQPPMQQQLYNAAQPYQGGGVPYQMNRHEAAEVAAPAVHIPRAANGHFYARVQINGHWTRMMIDTGATGVCLTRDFAARIGVDLRRLRYDLPIRTGNGTIRAAKVIIPVINVEGLIAHNVLGCIDQQQRPSDQCLLGNTFLHRLTEHTTRGNVMILRP